MVVNSDFEMMDPIQQPYICFSVKIRNSGLINLKIITRVFEELLRI